MFKKIIAVISVLSVCAALNAANPTANATQMVFAFANDWNSTTGFLQLFEREACKDSWKPVGDKIAKNNLG